MSALTRYEQLPDGRLRCPDCADETTKSWAGQPPERWPQHDCPHGARLPPLWRRLANFSRASIIHAVHLFPTCDEEEIDRRFGICQQCPLFLRHQINPQIGACSHKDCGCSITGLPRFISKLGWLDQHCPLRKW